MQVTVSLNVEDYVYEFYQKGSIVLGKKPEELMAQALFMYAGVVAQDLLNKDAELTDD